MSESTSKETEALLGKDKERAKDNWNRDGNDKKKKQKNKKMSKKHKKVMQRKLIYLQENTSCIERICTFLYQENVLLRDEEESIVTKPTNDQKIRALLDALIKKDVKSYDIFKQALLQSGNDHTVDELQKVEQELGSDDSDGASHTKRRKFKKGKLFSIYEASAGESSSEEEKEPDEFRHVDFDGNETRFGSLFQYLLYVEWYLKTIHYHPQKLYDICRFKEDSKPQSAFPFKTFSNSIQRFKVTRSVFLKSIGFFGPASVPITSYQVTIKLAIQMSVYSKHTIAETEGVFEMVNGKLTKVSFKKAQPIRPHMWHSIEFSIRGEEEMTVKEKSDQLRREKVVYETDQGSVVFDFDTSDAYSTSQLPQLYFYRGKEQIDLEHFPKPDVRALNDLHALYTVDRFNSEHEMTSANPIKFSQSIQRFRVNRPIFLKKVGFFGPLVDPVVSYEIKMKLMIWSDIDKTCTIAEADKLAEVERNKLLYVEFDKVPSIRPHIWHWIEFSIIGQEAIAMKSVDDKRASHVVPLENDIYESGIKFDFDTSLEYSTCQMPKLCFYQATDQVALSTFPESTIEHELDPDGQQLYCAQRFEGNEPMESVIPSRRYKKSCQRFRVNRAIYLKKVGFFGPERPGSIGSYEVKMKLVLWNSKKPPFVLSCTEKVVEVKHDELMYISFESAPPVRPHIWHWIEFSIKGSERMLIQNKRNKIDEFELDYQHGGAVKFEFDMTPCHSTCQIPELWFFKGKDEIPLSKFPKPDDSGNEKDKDVPPDNPDEKQSTVISGEKRPVNQYTCISCTIV